MHGQLVHFKGSNGFADGHALDTLRAGTRRGSAGRSARLTDIRSKAMQVLAPKLSPITGILEYRCTDGNWGLRADCQATEQHLGAPLHAAGAQQLMKQQQQHCFLRWGRNAERLNCRITCESPAALHALSASTNLLTRVLMEQCTTAKAWAAVRVGCAAKTAPSCTAIAEHEVQHVSVPHTPG
jgi:hypothetical protein